MDESDSCTDKSDSRTEKSRPGVDKSAPRLARSLASLLARGTWVASIVIAAGLVAAWSGEATAGAAITTAGIVLVVLLPVIRVGTVLAHFRAVGERKFVVGCALVLVIIAASVLAGL